METQAKKAVDQVRHYEKGAFVAQRKHDWHNNRLSSFESLPRELLDLIFSRLPRSSLAACALTSTQLYFTVAEALYSKVRLRLDRFTCIFAETLLRRPLLCDSVRKLTVAINPHWTSARALHDILKQIPRLVDLHVLPSWITYGDLPYWEYPFKLRKLKWGLMKDRASQKFIESQSDTLEEIRYLNMRIV
jgi:hypothetical protein